MINLNIFLPDCLIGIIEMQAIQDAISIQIDKLQQHVKTLQAQKHLKTSSGYGLNYWEKEYGITTDATISDVLRKESILAKIRGMGTITKAQIKQIANTYSGSEVELTENTAQYKFLIKFVGNKGIPANMVGLTNTINEIKPAHLDFDFIYSFNTWDMITYLTWSNVSNKTWTEIKTYE